MSDMKAISSFEEDEVSDSSGTAQKVPKDSEILQNEDEEEALSITEPTQSENETSEFYWKQSRENLFTKAGLRLFEIAYSHKNEEYNSARVKIDAEYNKLSPRLQSKGPATKHGGIFGTFISFLEEVGLMFREDRDGQVYLRSTSAGDQAALLLTRLPEALRIVPYFVVELLSRYRFNNPYNRNPKNQDLAREISDSDIFPYWSLYKIMRLTNNHLTKDELARFVFRTKRMADIPNVATRVLQYRSDVGSGLTEAELDNKYGTRLKGSIGQTKYIMGRAGFQVGVIKQEGDDFFINQDYLPFIDELLKDKPYFEELDDESWMKEYGAPVEATEVQYLPFNPILSSEPLTAEINDDDPVLIELKRLIEVDKFAGVILIGPPGTGKTWYARQIGIKLVQGESHRLREVQFHPSYQYEDFVEGYVPDGKGGFKLVDRHLLEMCRLADSSEEVFVLIIDELSRTEPARVMGEAMTYMETSLRGQRFYLPSGRAVVIPPNLIFLATMNPEDRSVDEIDAAMDRRWGKIYLAPDFNVLNSFLQRNRMSRKMRNEVSSFFSWIQDHYSLGHAFFRTVSDPSSLNRLWNNQLKFLFKKNFRYDQDTLRDIEERWGGMLSEIKKLPPEELQDTTNN